MMFLLRKVGNMNSETLKGWSILLVLGTAALAWTAPVVLLLHIMIMTSDIWDTPTLMASCFCHPDHRWRVSFSTMISGGHNTHDGTLAIKSVTCTLVLFSMLTKSCLFLLLSSLHSTGEFRAKQLKLPVSRQNQIPPSIRQKHWQKTTAIQPGKTISHWGHPQCRRTECYRDVNVPEGAGCSLYDEAPFSPILRDCDVNAMQRYMHRLCYVHELRTITSSQQEVKQIKNEAIRQFSE